MTDINQNPQPPPLPYQGQEKHRSDVSVTRGWVRIMENRGRYEVYWKGPSDVAVLITHTLCKDHAEAMQRDINRVLKRFTGLPFIENANVQCSEVEDHQQTQGG